VHGAASELVCLLVFPAWYVTEARLVEATGKAQDDALKVIALLAVMGAVMLAQPPAQLVVVAADPDDAEGALGRDLEGAQDGQGFHVPRGDAHEGFGDRVHDLTAAAWPLDSTAERPRRWTRPPT
jgi:hypothetical protein